MKHTRLIGITLLTALLTSCGGGAATPDADPGKETGNTTNAESTSPLDALPDADFGGVDFNIFGEYQSTLSDYFDVEEQTGEAIDDAVWKRNRAVEEKY